MSTCKDVGNFLKFYSMRNCIYLKISLILFTIVSMSCGFSIEADNDTSYELTYMDASGVCCGAQNGLAIVEKRQCSGIWIWRTCSYEAYYIDAGAAASLFSVYNSCDYV